MIEDFTLYIPVLRMSLSKEAQEVMRQIHETILLCLVSTSCINEIWLSDICELYLAQTIGDSHTILHHVWVTKERVGVLVNDHILVIVHVPSELGWHYVFMKWSKEKWYTPLPYTDIPSILLQFVEQNKNPWPGIPDISYHRIS